AVAMPASQNGAATSNPTPTTAGLDAISNVTRRMPMTNLRVGTIRTRCGTRGRAVQVACLGQPSRLSKRLRPREARERRAGSAPGSICAGCFYKPCPRIVDLGRPGCALGPWGASVARAREQPLQGLGIDGL